MKISEMDSKRYPFYFFCGENSRMKREEFVIKTSGPTVLANSVMRFLHDHYQVNKLSQLSNEHWNKIKTIFVNDDLWKFQRNKECIIAKIPIEQSATTRSTWTAQPAEKRLYDYESVPRSYLNNK